MHFITAVILSPLFGLVVSRERRKLTECAQDKDCPDTTRQFCNLGCRDPIEYFHSNSLFYTSDLTFQFSLPKAGCFDMHGFATIQPVCNVVFSAPRISINRFCGTTRDVRF